ncbi:unnamed protein product [Clonostachys chloroleuca]|uniref:Uncharacterized protein n=1 Tax=Clonostachys chloroleuca TaxID=1926264 RepID=A0AA35M0I8_9HYPO|nr:unnamed protein product [Clonostachys chloroleuca]
MSETVLQASLLILLYEIGHGIYPSAFLSAGSCVRYGHAIGLGGPQKCRLQRPLTRFTQLGRLAPIPSTGSLPDSRAVQMFGSSETILAHSTSSSGKEGSRDEGCFVLLAESTKLLGQVLSHISSTKSEGAVGSLPTRAQDELIQLDRTI